MRIGDFRKIEDFLPIHCARCDRDVERWEATRVARPVNGLRFKVWCHEETEECVFDPSSIRPDDVLVSAVAFRTPEEMGAAVAAATGWAPRQAERKARFEYVDALLNAGFERYKDAHAYRAGAYEEF